MSIPKLVEPEVPEIVVLAFEDRYRGQLDLARDDDEWRNTRRYKHDGVQAMWEGWRESYRTHSARSLTTMELVHAALKKAPSEGLYLGVTVTQNAGQ